MGSNATSLASSSPSATPSGAPEPRPSPAVSPAQSASLSLQVLADLLAVAVAYWSAFQLRLALGGTVFVRIDAALLDRLVPEIWLVLAVWLASAWWARLYRVKRRSTFDVFVQVVEAMALATVLTVALSFLLYRHDNGLSRAFIVLLFSCGLVSTLTMRAGLWGLARLARPRVRPENILIVGGSDDAIGLVDHFFSPESGVTVRGIVSTGAQVRPSRPVPVFAAIRDLRYAINQTRADRVVIADTEIPVQSLADCIEVCGAMYVPLNFTGGGLPRIPTVVELTEVAGVRLLEVRRPEFERTRDFLKRSMDIALGSTLLVLCVPLFIVLAVAIKWSSAGPVMFVADRVGRGGRHFPFLKFRTMVAGADALRPSDGETNGLDGHIYKAANDSRVTRVGRIMRRLSLDELPQLISVVRGDMSLVGPRPLPARDLDPDGLSARHRIWSLERASVRPGMTGLWQVRGRSGLPFEDMVRLDLLYVRTRSFRLDLQILIETIPAVLTGRGAM